MGRGKHKKQPNPYQKRDKVLRRLGYGSYQEYLLSDHWQKIRSKVLKQFPDCLICGVPAWQIHHASYDRLTMDGKRFDALAPLCGECHNRIEFNGDKKRGMHEVNQKLISGAANTESGRRWLDVAKVRKESFYQQEPKKNESPCKARCQHKVHRSQRKRVFTKGSVTHDPNRDLYFTPFPPKPLTLIASKKTNQKFSLRCLRCGRSTSNKIGVCRKCRKRP